MCDIICTSKAGEKNGDIIDLLWTCQNQGIQTEISRHCLANVSVLSIGDRLCFPDDQYIHEELFPHAICAPV
jgi:hypothetical protein